jgi:hypothetical protein
VMGTEGAGNTPIIRPDPWSPPAPHRVPSTAPALPPPSFDPDQNHQPVSQRTAPRPQLAQHRVSATMLGMTSSGHFLNYYVRHLAVVFLK